MQKNESSSKKKISVVLSFKNEDDVIEELVRRLRNVLRNSLKEAVSDYELIFVNDRSTDNSFELLKILDKDESDIKIINMSRTFGVSPCVLAGMELSSGDAVVYMDADLQDPPEVIPELVKVWLNDNADVVHTRRISRSGESKVKLFLTGIGYAILNKISGDFIKPEIGDFKLLSRRAVGQLVNFREKKPFVRGLVNFIGYKQEIVNYKRESRFAGETKFRIYGWEVISNFLDSALISFSDIPLKISLLLGFFISFSAFAYLLIVFIMKFSGFTLPGWAAIMATMLFLGGIQLLTIGVMGLYINTIYQESKNRPNYIIESTYGFDLKNAGNTTQGKICNIAE